MRAHLFDICATFKLRRYRLVCAPSGSSVGGGVGSIGVGSGVATGVTTGVGTIVASGVGTGVSTQENWDACRNQLVSKYIISRRMSF